MNQLLGHWGGGKEQPAVRLGKDLGRAKTGTGQQGTELLSAQVALVPWVASPPVIIKGLKTGSQLPESHTQEKLIERRYLKRTLEGGGILTLVIILSYLVSF